MKIVSTIRQYFNAYAALEVIHIHVNAGAYVINTAVFENNDGVITNKSHTQLETSDLIDLKDNTVSSLPKVLVFSGTGIMFKKASGVFDQPEMLLDEIYPDLEADQFYFEAFTIDSDHYVQIARRDKIDEIISPLQELGFQIVSIHIGLVFTGAMIQEYELQGEQDQVSLPGLDLTFRNGKVSEFKVGSESFEPIQIKDIDLEFEATNLFLSGLAFWSGGSSLSSIVPEAIEEAKENWQYNSLYGKLMKIVPVIVLIGLVVHALVFFTSHQRQNVLLEEYSVKRVLVDEYNDLQDFNENALNVLSDLGMRDRVTIAFYGDRLISKMPKGISLRALEVFPNNEDRRGKKLDLDFNKSLITISGVASSPKPVNEWISDIKEMEWVADVSENTYQFNNRLRKGVFEFNVMMK